MMRKIFLFTWVVLIGLSLNAWANMPAPLVRAYKGAEALQSSIPNLFVIKEKLRFESDAPYRKNPDTRYVRTSATYMIKAESETVADFDFILNVNQKAQALINGVACMVGEPELLHKWTQQHYPMDVDDSQYKVSFSGRLKPGTNTIQVTYQQPLGSIEYREGYPFSKTKIDSTFAYILAPLRQWNLDDNFTLEVKIIFKDDTGWLKHLFGSDFDIYLFSVYEQKIKSEDTPGRMHDNVAKVKTAIPVVFNKEAPNDVLEIDLVFNKDFPDALEVRCK